MLYLYLDESGDLGFDFANKKPSKFFSVTILSLESQDVNRQLIKAVKKTLARKLNPKGKRNRIVTELKGTSTTYGIKTYFYRQVKEIPFNVYSITLDKKKLYGQLVEEKERVYNFIARKVFDQIPFEKILHNRIQFIIDKSKSKPEIEEFNNSIRVQLQARIQPHIPMDIYHWTSNTTPGLQACDLFCWGIFQKHERKNTQWYNLFKKDKIKFDEVYSP